MRKKNYTFWLAIIYIVMAAVCAALIIFSKQNITSIIINILMFLIVGIIFIFASHRLSLAYRIQKALYNATQKIKSDAKSDTRYLWEQYKNEPGGGLFSGDALTRQYQKFTAEADRLSQFSNVDYKCDIEDYINKEYIDAAVKKNILNLVSGTMTGLGILGTFVGLSFGLQYFNTGTSAEITNSIAPLMEGIKVAFHTSIYGMVFSLVYSFVYKASMEAVYIQLDEFLSAFNTYVLGDSYNDNESSLRELVSSLPDALGAVVSEQMGQIAVNLNKTMIGFAQTIADTQAEGMRGLVNEFVGQMDNSMGNSLSGFGRVLNETLDIQKQNNTYALSVMDRLNQVTGNVEEINSLSMGVINNMAGYIGEMEKLQSVISENYNSTYRQMETMREHEERMQGYVYAIAANEKEVNESIKKELEEVIKISRIFSGEMQSTSQKLTNMLASARTEIDAAARELSAASMGLDEKLTTSLKETFELFDSNMAQAVTSLGDTVSRIDKTTDRVPEVVLAAYDSMKQSFDDMQKEMDSMIRALEKAGE